jgi:hypothetical protein
MRDQTEVSGVTLQSVLYRGSRFRYPEGALNFSLHHRVQNMCGHPKFLSNGYRWLFPWGVKRLGYETYHLPPSSVKVTNVWSYNSTPQYVFMAWCFIKYMGHLPFSTCQVHKSKIYPQKMPARDVNVHAYLLVAYVGCRGLRKFHVHHAQGTLR